LGCNQSSLDFIDVPTNDDVSLHIDPRAIAALPSDWGQECIALIRDFFSSVLAAVRDNNYTVGHDLLNQLREPKETHLGYSVQGTSGRGVGQLKADYLWDALRQSRAVSSGLLENLEETALLVEGIDRDIISDITTNIIREPLIEYTQAACQFYQIPLHQDVDSGPLWNPKKKEWFSKYVHLPIVGGWKLLLVPKVIVRLQLVYNQDEYYRHYILEELRHAELASHSPLVQVLKNGRTRVTNKSLQAKYGTGKAVLISQTLRHPSALDKYRRAKAEPSEPLTHIQLAVTTAGLPDWEQLLNNVLSLKPGAAAADAYEKAILALLNAVFYPSLVDPDPQCEIHEGRKRVDIRFTNMGHRGFFYWLAQHYPSSYVWIECKNYSSDPGNPEVDQLIGRFSPKRGKVGMLTCRFLSDKPLLLKRCRDAALADQGYIIALDDDDLRTLVKQRMSPKTETAFPLLQERFSELVN
jgi:hypothetical protein